MYTSKQIKEVVEDFRKYISETKDPTIVGFTSSYEKYSINKDYISDHKEFSDLRKRAIEKQEAYLLTAKDEVPAIRIFRLKQPQHGYSDRSQVENSGEQKIIIETRKHRANNND